MGATVKELRVVRTPLRVELHVVLKHPDRELPKRPVTNPVGKNHSTYPLPYG